MERTKTEQEFLDYCIKQGKGKLPVAMDLLELITDFIEVDRKKQLLIHSVSHCFFYDNELNHIRQWFNTTIDLNQDKDIEKTEWELGLKIHKCLNIRPENRIVKNCG